MARRLAIATALFFASSSAALAQQIRYVDDDAPPGGNGQSWAAAYRDLQSALTEAAASATIDEVRVAGGTYYPSVQASPGTPRTETFQLLSGLAVYGGYLGCPGGTCGVNPDERDILIHETILSGDLNGDDVPGEYPAGPSYADNCYHVVTSSFTDDTAVLDGATITGGNANGSSPWNEGGGVYNDLGAPTFHACLFTRNSAEHGGGISTAGGDPTIVNCMFLQNSAIRQNAGSGLPVAGGAISNGPSIGTGTVIDCVFSDNTATSVEASAATTQGGAVSDYGGLILVGSTFNGNVITSSGGVAVANGGAVFACDTTIVDCTFVGNAAYASASGWAALPYGGGVLLCHPSEARDCTFEDNVAVYGGGVAILGSSSHGSPILTNCIFNGNSAEQGGGAWLDGGDGARSGTLTNCSFSGNAATLGGAVFGQDGDARLDNCTITGNTASAGSAIHTWPGDMPVLSNCVLWGNPSDSGEQIEGPADIVSTCIEGGWPSGAGNVDADPLFVRTPDPGADSTWGTEDDDYGDLRIWTGSPCIDAGDNMSVTDDLLDVDDDGDTTEAIPLDLAGNDRFVDDFDTPDTGSAGNGHAEVVDMGAYEFQGGGVPGDLDGDYDADIDDYRRFFDCLTGTGTDYSPGCGLADLDRDGEVDLGDFRLLQGALTGPV